jgi:uncharacterized protein
MATWQCMENCGACCHLDPHDRPDLDQYLDPESLKLYFSLVGEDGWCVNFDPHQRRCRIYDDRPWFCRVDAQGYQAMFGIEPEELNDFAIDCCLQQIEGVYGDRSLEEVRYRGTVGLIEQP